MRSYRYGLLLGLILAAGVAVPMGCESGQFRDKTAIDAERASLETTIPYADCYKAQHPGEAQSVDDFYTVWRGRLDKEAAAAQ